MKNISTPIKVWIVLVLVLLADQAVKCWIKTHMTIGQELPVFGQWFIIRFIENNGMAFGMEWGGNFGKYLLSVFRIGAVGCIGWYIRYLIRQHAPEGFVLTCTLILAGAAGNIIDSMCYGLLFDQSTFTHVASFLPEGGGYAGFLQGKVVDMLYFPLVQGSFPTWIPGVGGTDFLFFRPIFNIADSAITIGVALILICYRNVFATNLKN